MMSCPNNHMIMFDFWMMGHNFMFMSDGCIATIYHKRVGEWRWDKALHKVIFNVNVRMEPADLSRFDRVTQESHSQYIVKQVLA